MGAAGSRDRSPGRDRLRASRAHPRACYLGSPGGHGHTHHCTGGHHHRVCASNGGLRLRLACLGGPACGREGPGDREGPVVREGRPVDRRGNPCCCPGRTDRTGRADRADDRGNPNHGDSGRRGGRRGGLRGGRRGDLNCASAKTSCGKAPCCAGNAVARKGWGWLAWKRGLTGC